MPIDSPGTSGQATKHVLHSRQVRSNTGEPSSGGMANVRASASPGLLWGAGLAVILVGTAALYYFRTAARRSWQAYAAEIQGEFASRNRFLPAFVSGSLSDRALFMESSTNNDDDAPYYQTRASMPISNPGMLIMGLRRKSLLEEAQSRNEKLLYEFGDSDFDRRFHLVSNDPEPLNQLLDAEIRKQLMRYSDIEIYVGINVVEWRRSGEVSDLQAIRQLNAALARIASTIDGLPKRSLSLSQRLADEELIRKGI